MKGKLRMANGEKSRIFTGIIITRLCGTLGFVLGRSGKSEDPYAVTRKPGDYVIVLSLDPTGEYPEGRVELYHDKHQTTMDAKHLWWAARWIKSVFVSSDAEK
ncbi:MAG: hypothetical protein LBT05_15240 [Planctomycetaceae bacterium]|nr:hypothetical protein [Planctomycetaceae bacterium]